MSYAQTTKTINNDAQIELNNLFYRALQEKNLQEAEKLLAQGAEINVVGPDKRSIFIYNEDLEIIN